MKFEEEIITKNSRKFTKEIIIKNSKQFAEEIITKLAAENIFYCTIMDAPDVELIRKK